MKTVRKVWGTKNGDEVILYCARVSNPKNQDSENAKLIQYLIKHGHWSPFEMVNLCLEINTTRDIGRQILRHRSFTFQEFSQRYANINELDKPDYREARMQDSKNRQNSIETNDSSLMHWFRGEQDKVLNTCHAAYLNAINQGIAKEQARIFLPEGLTQTRIYMNGTLRSWIHFLYHRLDKGAQKEIREIAKEVAEVISESFPVVFNSIMEYINYDGKKTTFD